MKLEAASFFRSSGSLTSEAFRIAGGAVALVLGVLVLKDGPDPVRRATHWAWQGTGKQVGMGPDIDSRLPRELSQQSAIGSYMGSDAHCTPVLRGFKQFDGILAARR